LVLFVFDGKFFDKIVPFNNYPVIGVKLQDLKDSCLVVEIMKTKEHLGQKKKIIEIKKKINSGRPLE
jgi:hypothetical protein